MVVLGVDALHAVAPAEHRIAAHEEWHEEDVGLLGRGDDGRDLEQLVHDRHIRAVRAQVLQVAEAAVGARVLAQVGAVHLEQLARLRLELLRRQQRQHQTPHKWTRRKGTRTTPPHRLRSLLPAPPWREAVAA